MLKWFKHVFNILKCEVTWLILIAEQSKVVDAEQSKIIFECKYVMCGKSTAQFVWIELYLNDFFEIITVILFVMWCMWDKNKIVKIKRWLEFVKQIILAQIHSIQTHSVTLLLTFSYEKHRKIYGSVWINYFEGVFQKFYCNCVYEKFLL